MSNLAGLNKGSEVAVLSEEREKSAYAEHLQNLLTDSTQASREAPTLSSKYLPLKSSNLIENMRDGVILGHLLESLNPGSVPWSKMDLSVDLENATNKKVIFEVTNNLNCVIEAAKKNKQLVVVNIGANDILEGKKDLVLGLLWQIVRAHLLASVNLHSHPELIRLLQPGESLQSLLSLKSETILLRWFNYHLIRSGYDLTNPASQTDSLSEEQQGLVNGFTASSIGDSIKYAILMEQIAPLHIPLEGLAEKVYHEQSLERKAEIVLEAAGQLHCRKFVTAQDIVKGHAKLNLAFTATLFNSHIGIHLPSEEEIQALLQERHSNAIKIADLEAKLKAVTEAREHETSCHAQELLALHQSLESQQSDLETSFHASLQDGLAAERKKWEDSYRRTFEKEKEYKRNLERHLRQLRNLLVSVHNNNNNSNSNLTIGKNDGGAGSTPADDLEVLTKEIVDMTKGLVLTNADLGVTCDKLKEKIKHNERLNDVFGTKIREFSEFLIQERKRNPLSK